MYYYGFRRRGGRLKLLLPSLLSLVIVLIICLYRLSTTPTFPGECATRIDCHSAIPLRFPPMSSLVIESSFHNEKPRKTYRGYLGHRDTFQQYQHRRNLFKLYYTVGYPEPMHPQQTALGEGTVPPNQLHQFG